ncbi:hypothetical protein 1 [Beihai rhabdo-like virus 5]|uniref:Uncharacterized protein n=1 Tax=Beihai rhabdo-like virus 5 TaxID=1922655 RepID=A0A1L3KMR4_9MONO|nr:hypothetical protein 1 [Beihai rhabdo-like virus 5]APG78646.1 hypothetical protein 1 [Beihai rhabdo-like virus 5]
MSSSSSDEISDAEPVLSDSDSSEASAIPQAISYKDDKTDYKSLNEFAVALRDEILTKLDCALIENRKLRRELRRTKTKVHRLSDTVNRLNARLVGLTNTINNNSIKLGQVTQEVERTKLTPHDIIRSTYLSKRKFEKTLEGKLNAAPSTSTNYEAQVF